MGTRDVSSTRYTFNLLDSKNWKTFSFKAQNKLEDEDRWTFIVDTAVPPTIVVQQPAVSPATGMVATSIVNPDYADWEKGNAKTMRRITEMVSDDQVAYIRDAKTAAEMWNNLRAIYEPTGMLSMMAIHEKLANIKYKGIESGPLQDHLDTVLGYSNDLQRGNDGISDYKLIQLTLQSLPEDFTGIVQTLGVVGATMSFNAATPILLQEEKRQRNLLEKRQRDEHALKAQTEHLALAKAHDDEVAANAIKAYFASTGGSQRSGGGGGRGGRGGRGGGGGSSGGDWKRDVTCYGCGNKGHIKRDCTLTGRDQLKEKLRLAQIAYDGAGGDEHPKVLLTKKATHSLRPDALFVDSGSSRNLTSERASFITYTTLDKPIPIQLGDNSEIHAVGTGTSARRIKSPTGVQTVHFTRTLHVPKLAGSLLSVGQLTAIPGVKLEFEGKICFIKLHGATLCEAVFKDGLYTLELADSPDSAVLPNGSPSLLKAKTPAPAGKRLDILTLHRRLGHLNISDLRKLISAKMVDGLDLGIAGDDFSCDACLRGKTPRKSFPKGGRRRATRVLEIVHSDVCGPVDVDFMKLKSSALARFRTWKARVEKQTGQKIGIIRTDNGGEYTSDEFEALLATEGIIHQTTAPYSSQQGGVSERVNRTLEDSVRANLIEAELPIGFWPDAVAYGASTRNFCPTHSSLDGRIPEEAWTGRRQDVSHLRPFGCEVYVSVLPLKGRPKLADTTVKCILLGYYDLPGTQSKAYKCYDRVKRKVHKSSKSTPHYSRSFYPC